MVKKNLPANARCKKPFKLPCQHRPRTHLAFAFFWPFHPSVIYLPDGWKVEEIKRIVGLKSLKPAQKHSIRNQGIGCQPTQRQCKNQKPLEPQSSRGFWLTYMWGLRDSNPRPSRCKRDALPTELSAPLGKRAFAKAFCVWQVLSDNRGTPGGRSDKIIVQLCRNLRRKFNKHAAGVGWVLTSQKHAAVGHGGHPTQRRSGRHSRGNAQA